VAIDPHPQLILFKTFFGLYCFKFDELGFTLFRSLRSSIGLSFIQFIFLVPVFSISIIMFFDDNVSQPWIHFNGYNANVNDSVISLCRIQATISWKL
jgi:hypothetical protein